MNKLIAPAALALMDEVRALEAEISAGEPALLAAACGAPYASTGA